MLKEGGGGGCGGWGGYYVPFVSGSLLSVQHGRPSDRCKGQQMCLSGAGAVHGIRLTLCSWGLLSLHVSVDLSETQSICQSFKAVQGIAFPLPPPLPYCAHMRHMTLFSAIAQLSTCPCRRFALEIVRWDTARFTPSALLRNHPRSLESVAILDRTSRTVPDRSVSVTQKRHEACLLWNDRLETIESILVLFPHCAFFLTRHIWIHFFLYFIFFFKKLKHKIHQKVIIVSCYLIYHYAIYYQAACAALCLRGNTFLL